MEGVRNMSENNSFDNDMNDIDKNDIVDSEVIESEVINGEYNSINEEVSQSDKIELDDNVSKNKKKSNIGLCIGLVAMVGVIIFGITKTTGYFIDKKSDAEAVITVPPEKSETKITTTDSKDG